VKQEFYEALGTIRGGRFVGLGDRTHFESAMQRFPDGPVGVRFEVLKDKRSARQNRYWHAVVVPLFAAHCGYDVHEMKDVLALELLPVEVPDLKTGEIKIIPGHTSELTTKAFNELIERALRLGAEMGVYIPEPNEVAA
jgi:hypothetical protein